MVKWDSTVKGGSNMEEFLSDDDLNSLLDGDPNALAGELEIEGMDEAMEMSASNRRYEEIIKKHSEEN